jgi:hypothetical protein
MQIQSWVLATLPSPRWIPPLLSNQYSYQHLMSRHDYRYSARHTENLFTIIKSTYRDPQYNCDLLRLPADLRYMIYEYALLRSGEILYTIKNRAFGNLEAD